MWGLVLVVVVVVVTGVNQSQLLIERLSLEFDNMALHHPTHSVTLPSSGEIPRQCKLTQP